MSLIRINQMGFSTQSPKAFVYVGKAQTFQVMNVDNKQVYEGQLQDFGEDEQSGDYVCIGDFSTIKEAGEYYIKVGNESSGSFTISDHQPVICTDALLKAFYYQRCGMELTEEYAGPWHHGACHKQTAYIFRESIEQLSVPSSGVHEELEISGGWHDAGDYGRYTVPAAKAVADLLLAYENYKEVFDHPIGIPESEKKGADILHEVRYELDFLLKMQRKSDGAVYTKIATRYFCGMIMPEEDKKPLYVFRESSPATAAFAAIMAMAARVYNDFDSEFARQCLKASEAAYEWLIDNPEPLLFENPANIESGEYGDISDIDERYWAAAELYRTTGENKYLDHFIMHGLKLNDKLSLGWKNVSGYGTIAYLLSERDKNSEAYKLLTNEWLSHAKELEERSKSNGYGITLALNEYPWGSTMVIFNQCMQLAISNLLLKDNRFDQVIHNNWDYIFGKNPMDISYVTGLGKQSVRNPHHRPSIGDRVEEPVPGLLSGGPCSGLNDEIAKKYCQGNPPGKCFIDHAESYSTNEIAIYWNSPAVYVGAAICARLRH